MSLSYRRIRIESLYHDGDITDYVNLYIRNKLGGYKLCETSGCECCFLLKNEFTDLISNNNYIIAITPAINSQQIASLCRNRNLQSATEQIENRKDVFDELIPLLFQTTIAYIRILFPYNISQSHWLTGEILIHKNFDDYQFEIFTHDPYGGGQMEEENFESIITAMNERIQDLAPAAIISFENSRKISPYEARQHPSDKTSCGVIVAKDIIERVEGKSLTRNEGVYSIGAEILREEQINLFVSELHSEHKTRINFLARNTSNQYVITSAVPKPHIKINTKMLEKIDLIQNYFQTILKAIGGCLELDEYKFKSKHIKKIEELKSLISSNIESRFKIILSANDYEQIQKYIMEYKIIQIKSYYIFEINSVTKELLANNLQAEFLYNIGKEFIETEIRCEFLKELGLSKHEDGEEIRKDSELLEIMKLAIYYTKCFKLTKESKVFLGILGACSHELISRKSSYIQHHSGIPWKAMSYLHRALSEDNRETKLLPGAFFTEGIYYDDKLCEEGLSRIINTDLDELYISFESILTKQLYCQVFPISNNILLLYHFYYNESNLQFIRYASAALSERISFITDCYDSLDHRTRLQGYFIYIINIGESFSGMSYNIAQHFNPTLVKAFREARNILAHPERVKNKQKVEDLLSGKVTLHSFLGIEEDKLYKEIELIHDKAIQLLRREYNYKFNVKWEEIAFFPDGENIEVDPYQLPKQAQRIMTAYENISRDLDGTIESFALAYELRPIEDILRTDYIIEDFITSVESSVKAKVDINYIACIVYLQHNISFFKEQNSTGNNRQFLEDFEKVLSTTGSYLVNVNCNVDKMKSQLLFLTTFISEDDEKIKTFISKITDKWFSNLYTISEEHYEESILLIQIFINHNPSSESAKELLNYFRRKLDTQETKREENLERIDKEDKENSFKYDYVEDTTDLVKNQKLQKEAELAFVIIKSIDLAFQEFFITYKYYQKSLGTELEPFKEKILGPTIWYHYILMGSLSRYVLEQIKLISDYYLPEFKIFFKAYFQLPRGDIAHNQIPLVGDQDYVRSIKYQRDARVTGKLVMISPESITLHGVQKDSNGIYYVEIKPWKDFPASFLKSDSIVNHHHVKPTYIRLVFMSMIGKTIYCYHTIVRDKKGKIALDVYLCDKQTDFIDLKSNNAIKYTQYWNTGDFSEIINKNKDFLVENLRSVTLEISLHYYYSDQLIEGMESTKAAWSQTTQAKRELKMNSHSSEDPSIIRFNKIAEHVVRQRSKSLPAIIKSL